MEQSLAPFKDVPISQALLVRIANDRLRIQQEFGLKVE